MNREDIIRMALEADIDPHDMCEDPRIAEHSLERFFHMAQAAMIGKGWRQCAKGQRTTQFCGMVEQAVQEEREACAKVCDKEANDRIESYHWTGCASYLAHHIRSRGEA